MVTSRELADKRRYFIVAAFILAALLAPPEVVPQLAVAVPPLAPYEAAIALFRWIESSR
jgi:sec-independent protein translocase protein TatC